MSQGPYTIKKFEGRHDRRPLKEGEEHHYYCVSDTNGTPVGTPCTLPEYCEFDCRIMNAAFAAGAASVAPHQGKELTDQEIERIENDHADQYGQGRPSDDDASGPLVERARGIGYGLRYARDHGYLRPSPGLSVDEVMEVMREWMFALAGEGVLDHDEAEWLKVAEDLRSRLEEKTKGR